MLIWRWVIWASFHNVVFYLPLKQCSISTLCNFKCCYFINVHCCYFWKIFIKKTKYCNLRVTQDKIAFRTFYIFHRMLHITWSTLKKFTYKVELFHKKNPCTLYFHLVWMCPKPCMVTTSITQRLLKISTCTFVVRAKGVIWIDTVGSKLHIPYLTSSLHYPNCLMYVSPLHLSIPSFLCRKW